ncbi:MAG: hypothetical protein IKA68_01230 [Clostridia bacterium]|nr:hypothetical protein [Clostridia bacterium]
MTFLKKICRDRRGMAMEMAMLVMVVTFALGTLMVTVALMQNNSVSAIERDFNEKVELEQIGEDFCRQVEEGELNAEILSSEYDVSIDAENLVLVAKKKDSGDVAMTIDIDVKDNTYEIVKWEIK